MTKNAPTPRRDEQRRIRRKLAIEMRERDPHLRALYEIFISFRKKARA